MKRGEKAMKRITLPNGGTARVTAEGAKNPKLIAALGEMMDAVARHYGKTKVR